MGDISDKMMARLPKTVRYYIERMEADLQDMQDRMATIIGGLDTSNVMLPYYLPDLEAQYLPKNTRVQFALQNPRRPTDMGYIAVHHIEDGRIHIHGSHPITIEPDTANSCTINLRDD